jgi:hypothetical protein
MSVAYGAFTPATYQDVLNAATVIAGNKYYLDPVNGDDTFAGTSASAAVRTLAQAYALCVSGHNDTIYLIGDGTATGSTRLSASFTWAKNATHLIGVASPALFSQRGRIATPTATTTAFTPFFTVSGSGCLFQNIQWYQQFATGTTSQICMVVSGSRNVFQNCAFDGMQETASAGSAGSRNLKITGGENVFQSCSVGTDTFTRAAANASVEFASGTARNVFRDCLFPFITSSATVLGIIVSAAAGSDRFQLFERCVFINAIKSTSTQMSALATLAASMGGMLLFKESLLVGITTFGTDATSSAQIYTGKVVSANVAASGGIAVVPA